MYTIPNKNVSSIYIFFVLREFSKFFNFDAIYLEPENIEKLLPSSRWRDSPVYLILIIW